MSKTINIKLVHHDGKFYIPMENLEIAADIVAVLESVSHRRLQTREYQRKMNNSQRAVASKCKPNYIIDKESAPLIPGLSAAPLRTPLWKLYRPREVMITPTAITPITPPIITVDPIPALPVITIPKAPEHPPLAPDRPEIPQLAPPKPEKPLVLNPVVPKPMAPIIPPIAIPIKSTTVTLGDKQFMIIIQEDGKQFMVEI